MIGLLRANFSRMWTTTAFRGCLIVPAMLILMGILNNGSMYNTPLISLFFAAVFAAMYIGTDNSDRTVRNKLIIGISRVKIYFANLITVSIGMALIFAVDWLARIGYDFIRGGGLNIELWLLVLYAVLCLIAGVAMMAVCTLLATLVTSRAIATALTISLMIGMFFGQWPLLYLSYSLSADNPFMSDVVGAIHDLMPTSQIDEIGTWILFVNASPEIVYIKNALEPMWYSLGLCAAVTVIGVLAFRKKDLK